MDNAAKDDTHPAPQAASETPPIIAQGVGMEENGDFLPRPLVRLVLGAAASVSGFPALWLTFVTLGIETCETQNRLAMVLLLPLMVLAGVFVGWAAFARFSPVRIAAWTVAGYGAGFLLDGMLGCLSAGDVLGPSSLVLSLVFATLGYRQDSTGPKQANTGQPLSLPGGDQPGG